MSSNRTRPSIVICAFAFLLAGCQRTPPTVATPRLTIATPELSPTPALCTELPEGAEVIITPLASTQIQIDLTGMQPGESLVFLFIARPIEGQTEEIGFWPQEVVRQDGSFTITESSLEPLPGNAINTWTVKVIHSRGVACQDVTLP